MGDFDHAAGEGTRDTGLRHPALRSAAGMGFFLFRSRQIAGAEHAGRYAAQNAATGDRSLSPCHCVGMVLRGMVRSHENSPPRMQLAHGSKPLADTAVAALNQKFPSAG